MIEDILSNAGNVMIVLVVALLAAAGVKLWQQSREDSQNNDPKRP